MKTAEIRIPNRNSDFQVIETLRRNRVKRSQAGLFFIEGVRAINQAVQNGWELDALVYTRDKRLSDWAEEDPSELIALGVIPADDLARIPIRANPLVVVLDRPVLPGNIGTVIRSCDALRVDGIIITGHSADLYDPETIRATTGSFFRVPSVRLPSHKELFSWIGQLKERSPRLKVVGTSARASLPIDAHDFTLPTLIVAGSETHGLTENYKALCDVMLTWPAPSRLCSTRLTASAACVRKQSKEGLGGAFCAAQPLFIVSPDTTRSASYSAGYFAFFSFSIVTTSRPW
jgi:TrmH family RNA methyltransferase